MWSPDKELLDIRKDRQLVSNLGELTAEFSGKAFWNRAFEQRDEALAACWVDVIAHQDATDLITRRFDRSASSVRVGAIDRLQIRHLALIALPFREKEIQGIGIRGESEPLPIRYVESASRLGLDDQEQLARTHLLARANADFLDDAAHRSPEVDLALHRFE